MQILTGGIQRLRSHHRGDRERRSSSLWNSGRFITDLLMKASIYSGTLAILILCRSLTDANAQTLSKPDSINGSSMLPESPVEPAFTPDTPIGTWTGSLSSSGDSVSGTWSEQYDLQEDSSGNVSGTRKSIANTNPNDWVVWSETGTVSGSTAILNDGSIIQQSNAAPSTSFCQDTTTMSMSADLSTGSGSWTAPGCGGGTISVSLQSASSITLSPITLLQILASAVPESGTFSLALDTADSDGNSSAVPTVALSQASENPNTITVTEPANPSSSGQPSQGSYSAENLTFTSIGQTYAQPGSVTKRFNVAVYGMSCYYNALWSDWQDSQGNCGTTSIRNITYSGTVQNPYGLAGTYCSAFIATTVLEGSGLTQSGQEIQYNPNAKTLGVVSQITTSDGDVITVNYSVARDPNYLASGTSLNINGIGSNLVADDTGGGITGYRLDVYKGSGQQVCQNYPNTMRVTQCNPADSTSCPGANWQ